MDDFARPATSSRSPSGTGILAGKAIVLLVALGIVLIAGWLRLTSPHLTLFQHDEGEWSNLALDFVRGEGIPLVGVRSSVSVNTGPIFVYLIALPMLFSAEPAFVTGFIGVLNTLGVGLAFVFTRRYFGLLPAVAAGLLYSTNPWAVFYSRKIWNPDVMPLLALLFTWAMVLVAAERRPRYLALATATCVAAIQVHQSGLVLGLILLAVVVLRWRWLTLGSVGLAAVCGIVMAGPFLFHELATGWADVKHALSLTAGPAYVDGDAIRHTLELAAGWRFPDEVYGIWTQPGESEPDSPVANAVETALLAVGLLAAASRVSRRGSGGVRNEGVATLLVLMWLVLPPLVLSRHSFEVYKHYLLLTQPAQFIVAGLGVNAIAEAIALAARRVSTWKMPAARGAGVAMALLPVLLVGALQFRQNTEIVGMIDRNGLEQSYGVPVRYYEEAFETIDRLRNRFPGEPVVWAPDRVTNTIRYFTRIGDSPVRQSTDSDVVLIPGDGDQDRVFVNMFNDGALDERLLDLGFQELPEETIAVPGGQTFFRFYRIPAGTRARILASLSHEGPDSRLSNGYALSRWDYHAEGGSADELQLRTAWEIWRAPKVSSDPRDCLSQHLIDVDGRELSVRDLTVEETRFLQEGDLVLAWSDVPVPADVERQQAWLDLGMFGCWQRETAYAVDRQGTKVGGALRIGPFAVGRSLDPADIRPQRAAGVRLGESVELVGYDVDQAATGAQRGLRVVLYWRAVSVPQADYTVFVQLLRDGELVAQQDNPPKNGRYPTSLWEDGEIVADEYVLTLPANLPDGEYHLIAGMYTRADLRRLPVATSSGQPVGDAVDLGSLQLERGRITVE